MCKADVKFNVMKVIKSDTSDIYKDLIDMELVVIAFKSSCHENNTVIYPLKYEDYDKYFRWLFDRCYENSLCVSDNYEGFKKEIAFDSEDLLPTFLTTTELEFVRELTQEDNAQNNLAYEKYFRDVLTK